MKTESAIDHEAKKIYDSVVIIASEDSFKLLFDLMKLIYERREFCRAAIELRNTREEIVITNIKHRNENIKKLLML